jgi:hypothetical protein
MTVNPRQAEKHSREVVEEAIRTATDAGYEATQRATEKTGQTAQTMADLGRQTTTAAADAMRRNAEHTSEIWRSGSVVGGQIVERSMEQFSRLIGLAGGNTQQTVQRSFDNLQAMAESGTNIGDGFRNASAEWVALAENIIGHNFDRVNALMGCRGVDECVAVETEFARDNLEQFLQSTRRILEISAQAAEQAARRVSQASLAAK